MFGGLGMCAGIDNGVCHFLSFLCENFPEIPAWQFFHCFGDHSIYHILAIRRRVASIVFIPCGRAATI